MEVELNLLDYWKIVRRHLKLILFTVIATVAAAAVITFFVVEPEYEATATLLVQSQKSKDQIAYNDVLANQQLVKTYGEIVKSRQIAENVIQNLSLDMSVPQLLTKVKVTAANESLVTSIIVTDVNAERASLIANGFAQSFYTNLNKIMKVDNVSILDQATVNPQPIRPKPLLNLVAAFFIGLVLGCLLALVIESLDKTLKNEDEIEEKLGIPVLGVIAEFGSGEKKGTRKRKVRVGGKTREV